MIRKSKKALATVFYVPNTPEGETFIQLLKKYLNRATTKMRVRGRNENRKQFKAAGHYSIRQWVPMDLATYFAVYIDRKDIERNLQDNHVYQQIGSCKQEYLTLRHQILAAKKEVTALHLTNSNEINARLERLLINLDSTRKFFF